MRTVNLQALSQFSFEDVESLLSWLENIPTAGISLEKMKNNPPVRTSKINSMLKVLESMGFISKKQDRFSLSGSGKEFSQSSISVKKANLRNQFLKLEPVRRVIELLFTSANGRIPVKLVHESFNLGALSLTTDADILGFISWAQTCQLFGFDKQAGEIFKDDKSTFTLPKAS